MSEAEVFPVYDEEAELELDTHSHTGTSETDHSPHLLHTQDSGTVVARASDVGPHISSSRIRPLGVPDANVIRDRRLCLKYCLKC